MTTPPSSPQRLFQFQQLRVSQASQNPSNKLPHPVPQPIGQWQFPAPLLTPMERWKLYHHTHQADITSRTTIPGPQATVHSPSHAQQLKPRNPPPFFLSPSLFEMRFFENGITRSHCDGVTHASRHRFPPRHSPLPYQQAMPQSQDDSKPNPATDENHPSNQDQEQSQESPPALNNGNLQYDDDDGTNPPRRSLTLRI